MARSNELAAHIFALSHAAKVTVVRHEGCYLALLLQVIRGYHAVLRARVKDVRLCEVREQ